jgi:uncharacterized protein YjgD (DUF1641 family)
MFLISTCLFAQVWIYDSANHNNDQNDWTAPVWGFIHDDGVENYDSPFYDTMSTNMNAVAKGDSSDFLPENGWELLKAYLGKSTISLINGKPNQNPFCVLYNKHTGIIRFLTAEKRENNSHTKAFLQMTTWGDNGNNTGILSTINTGKDYIYALDQRNNYDSKKNVFKFSYHGTAGGWIYADFFVAYDDIEQSTTNELRFMANHVDITDLNLDILEHNNSSANTSSNFQETIQFATSVSSIFTDGLSTRSYIELIDEKALAAGVPVKLFKFLNNSISFINSSSLPGIRPLLTVAGGLLNLFSGNGKGANVAKKPFQVSITGTATHVGTIRDFTLNQPGALPSGTRTELPDYNETLGVVQIETSPQINFARKRDYLPPDSLYIYSREVSTCSYKLSVLPDNFKVNPHSGLKSTSSDVKISLSFDVPNLSTFNCLMNNSKYFDYLVHYETKNGKYYFYTQFLDYQEAQDIVISIKNLGASYHQLSSISVKVMATFEYTDPSIIDPYIFIANYKPIINAITGTDTEYFVKPTQRIQIFLEDETINLSNFEIDRKIVVDYGCSLTINNCFINKIATSDSQFYGFEIRNGAKLILNNCTLNLGDGFIKVIGDDSELIINDLNINDRAVTVNNGKIDVLEGGKITLNNSKFEITNSDEVIVNKGKIDLTNSSDLIIDNHSTINFQNNSELSLDESSLITKTNSNINLYGHSKILSNQSSLNFNNSSVLLYHSTLDINYDYVVVCSTNVEIDKGNFLSKASFTSFLDSFLTLDNCSLVQFENCSHLRTENTHILGRKEYIPFELDDNPSTEEEPNDYQYVNIRIDDEVLISPGDRIVFKASRAHLLEGTKIYSDNNSFWKGLIFENSRLNGFYEGFNELRGVEISNLQYIVFSNSGVIIDNSVFHHNKRLQMIQNAFGGMSNSEYIENSFGMSIDFSNFSINNSLIENNDAEGIRIFNTSGFVEISNSEIMGNHKAGIDILSNSFVQIANTIISDNKYGITSISYTPPIISNNTKIFNNIYSNILAIGESFPQFTVYSGGVNTFIGQMSNVSDIVPLYFLYATNADTITIHINNLDIDATDALKFSPSINTFCFDCGYTHIPIPVDILFDLALDYIDASDYKEAYSTLKDLIVNYPNDSRVPHSLSFLPFLCYIINNDFDDVLEFLNENFDLENEKNANYVKGVIEILQNDFLSAIIIFESVIKDPPTDTMGLLAELNQAYCYYLLYFSNMRSLPSVATHKPQNYSELKSIQKNIMNKLLNILDDEKEDGVILEVTKFTSINYPNPFNPETTIKFTVGSPSTLVNNNNSISHELTSLVIYNIKGQKVKTLVNEYLVSGEYKVVWNGTNEVGQTVGSGIYFYRLKVGDNQIIKKMVLMK